MALETNIKTQLQTYLEMLREPIVLAASLDESPAAKEMLELLEEVSAMSDKITLTHEDDARKPSFAVKRATPGAKEVGVRFAGIPMGHEFTSLVIALLQVGGHPLKLEAEKIEQIAALDEKFHFETYISLS